MDEIYNHFFVFYDTESTDNKPTLADIISLGAVLAVLDHGVNFRKLGEFHEFIQTRKPIEEDAIAVHHITPQILIANKAQPFPDVLKSFQDWIKQFLKQPTDRLTLVAHNGAGFDDLIMFCNFAQNRMGFDSFLDEIHCHGFLDTLKMLRAVTREALERKTMTSDHLPKKESTGKVSFALGCCHECFCQCPIGDEAHNALVDSQALFRICSSPAFLALIGNADKRKWLSYVVLREQAVKQLKQQAGLRYEARLEQLRDAEVVEEDDEEKKDWGAWGNVDEEPSSKPVFKIDNIADGRRLCLNCMRFWAPSEHLQCTVVPHPFQMGMYCFK